MSSIHEISQRLAEVRELAGVLEDFERVFKWAKLNTSIFVHAEANNNGGYNCQMRIALVPGPSKEPCWDAYFGSFVELCDFLNWLEQAEYVRSYRKGN